jgi:hypothetical protein
MRYITRFGKIFVICLLIVLVYTLVQGWQEAGAIGFLQGSTTNRLLGFLEYWLFWIILYTGPFFLLVTFVLAVVVMVLTLIFDFGIALLHKR